MKKKKLRRIKVYHCNPSQKSREASRYFRRAVDASLAGNRLRSARLAEVAASTVEKSSYGKTTFGKRDALMFRELARNMRHFDKLRKK